MWGLGDDTTTVAVPASIYLPMAQPYTGAESLMPLPMPPARMPDDTGPAPIIVPNPLPPVTLQQIMAAQQPALLPAPVYVPWMQQHLVAGVPNWALLAAAGVGLVLLLRRK